MIKADKHLRGASRLMRHAVLNGAEDAFFVVNLQEVKERVEEWTERLPRVKPFFAVKCNHDDQILGLMANLGVGFDCASKSEIDAVRSHDVPVDKIIYANPCKQPSHLIHAAHAGVELMTFDSVEELQKISRLHPSAQLLLRIQVDDSKSVCQNMNLKFGAQMDDVPFLLDTAAELGVAVRGVSYHVGSGCYSTDSFVRAVRKARDIFDLAHVRGFDFDLLDIGGGFPAVTSTTSDASDVSFQSICNRLRPELDRLFPEDGQLGLLAEPGRYLVHSSHTLAVNIIGRKIERSNGGASVHYYVNDGIYGSFNNLIYDHAEVHPQVLFTDSGSAATTTTTAATSPDVHFDLDLGVRASSVWGQSCDGLDCILETVPLPLLEPGQWLLFENMGAYTSAAASNFNGFPTAQKLYIGADQAADCAPARSVPAMRSEGGAGGRPRYAVRGY